jgi:hypothetical protein
VSRDPFLSRERRAADTHVPTDPQRRALERLTRAEPGHVALLHGITGSGKTLVYLELLRRVVLEEGKSAIVLVPEIALTPQTVDRFRAVFGDQIAVLHSALSDGERYDAWLALRRGEKRIAVGARLGDLRAAARSRRDRRRRGARVELQAGRGAALSCARGSDRARAAEGAVVVLGSATPSLESWTNAQSGKYELLTLPERAGLARLPKVAVVDLRTERAKSPPSETPDADAAFAMAVSPPLAEALRVRLTRRSRASCCSTGAAMRRSCSAAPAETSPRARTAASASRITARPSGWCATTASTPKRCGSRVRVAAARDFDSAGSARSRWSACSRSDIRRRASREWTSTRRAGSGRTRRSSIVWPRGRWTSCSARR